MFNKYFSNLLDLNHGWQQKRKTRGLISKIIFSQKKIQVTLYKFKYLIDKNVGNSKEEKKIQESEKLQ